MIYGMRSADWSAVTRRLEADRDVGGPAVTLCKEMLFRRLAVLMRMCLPTQASSTSKLRVSRGSSWGRVLRKVEDLCNGDRGVRTGRAEDCKYKVPWRGRRPGVGGRKICKMEAREESVMEYKAWVVVADSSI